MNTSQASAAPVAADTCAHSAEVNTAILNERILAFDVSSQHDALGDIWLRTPRREDGSYTAYARPQCDMPAIVGVGPYSGVSIRDTTFSEVVDNIPCVDFRDYAGGNDDGTWVEHPDLSPAAEIAVADFLSGGPGRPSFRDVPRLSVERAAELAHALYRSIPQTAEQQAAWRAYLDEETDDEPDYDHPLSVFERECYAVVHAQNDAALVRHYGGTLEEARAARDAELAKLPIQRRRKLSSLTPSERAHWEVYKKWAKQHVTAEWGDFSEIFRGFVDGKPEFADWALSGWDDTRAADWERSDEEWRAWHYPTPDNIDRHWARSTVNYDEFNRILAGEFFEKTPAPAQQQPATTQPQPPSPRFKLRRAGTSKPAPIKWLAKKLLAERITASIIGASFTGKSLCTIALAGCVSSGTSFFGFEIKKPGPVIYIAGEGADGLERRVAAWCLRNGVRIEDVEIYISECGALLDQESQLTEVIQAVDAIVTATVKRPSLVIVDTFARNFSGNENSTEDRSRYIRAADAIRDRYDCAVITVGHTGLAENAQGRERGSGAAYAAWDAEFLLRAKGGKRILECTKAKDWAMPEPITLEIESIELPADWNDPETGEATTSAVVVQAGGAEQPSALNDGRTDNQRAILDVVSKLADPATGRVLTCTARDSVVASGAMVRGTFYRVLKGMVEKAMLSQDGEYIGAAPTVDTDALGRSLSPSLTQDDETETETPGQS